MEFKDFYWIQRALDCTLKSSTHFTLTTIKWSNLEPQDPIAISHPAVIYGVEDVSGEYGFGMYTII